MTEYSPAKTGEYSRIFPNVQNLACCEKYLRIINTIASIWREDVLAYLSLNIIFSSKLRGFTHVDNSCLLGTDNVHGQISVHVSHQMKAVVDLCVLRTTRIVDDD